MAVKAQTWLELMEREYLRDTIPAGGGAVRFVVADPPQLAQAAAGLRAMADAAGLHSVSVDVAQTRLHMLQNVVFALSHTLNWDTLLGNRLERLVASAGYRWTDLASASVLTALAEAHGVAPHLIQRELVAAMSREIWQDHQLTQDFRNAMIALLQGRLTGEIDPVIEAIDAWLRGTIRSLVPLRPAHVGRRIDRQNARATLVSLCHWVRLCGGSGVLLLLDIRQLHVEKRDVQEGYYYSPAAVMDCYEVLRQLVDDAGRMPGLFVTVLADPAFLSDDPRRSLGQYTALQMRVWDDVRPKGLDNALAPLVRLEA